MNIVDQLITEECNKGWLPVNGYFISRFRSRGKTTDPSVFHSDHGPAFESEKLKMWYQWGKRHRVGGPAVEFTSGPKFWLQNDLLHREDGPAVERAEGNLYFLHGEEVSEKEFLATQMRKRSEETRFLLGI